MRRTVMTLTAAGLLLAAACGQDDSDVTSGRDGMTPAAETASATPRRSAKSTASAAPADEATTTTTTTTTTPPGSDDTDDGSGGSGGSGETPAPTEEAAPAGATDGPQTACGDGGDGPDIAPVRGRPADAPPECLELGTGDVQVTLRWSSPADLDLHVTEPDGTEIWYGDSGPTGTGGELDVDSNVGCVQEASVENVFWPTGQSPEGQYTIEVVGYQVDDCGSGSYTLTAKVRGEEVLVETGSVGEDETDTYEIDV